MVDITAKRAPTNIADSYSNQGIATKAQLRALDREARYRNEKSKNKKSTWDKIVGGVSDVIGIGKGVMDLANSYEDLQIKDEQLEAAKVKRQQLELQTEQNKKNLAQQSIQNDRQLKEIKLNNEFLDKLSSAEESNNNDDFIKTILENPNEAIKNTELITPKIKELEEQGHSWEANVLKAVLTNDINLLKDQQKNSSVADPEEYKNSMEYKAIVKALDDNIFSDPNNVVQMADLGLSNKATLADDILTKCTNITTSDTQDTNEAVAKYNAYVASQSDDGGDYSFDTLSGIKNVDLPENTQFITFTCNVNGEPVTKRLTYDANKLISAPLEGVLYPDAMQSFDSKSSIYTGTAVAKVIANHKKYLDVTNQAKRNEVAITAEKVIKEQMIKQAYAQAQERNTVQSDSVKLDKVKSTRSKSAKSIKKEQSNKLNELYSKYANDKEALKRLLRSSGISESKFNNLGPADKAKISRKIIDKKAEGKDNETVKQEIITEFSL